MFHNLQVYLRKDRELHIRFSKSPSTLAQSDSRRPRLETGDKTTTPNHPAPTLIQTGPQPDNPSSPMAQDMRGHSWRSFAAAHLAPIKDYIAHRSSDPQATHYHTHHFFHHQLPSENEYDNGDAKKSSWRSSAKRSYSDSDGVTSTEKIVLLPGWASRRYRAGPELSNRTGSPYDIEVFVSGYVVKHKDPNTLSRSQRTLLRLAKTFASLPKLPDLCHGDSTGGHLSHTTGALTKSEEDLLLSKAILRDEGTEESGGEHVLHQPPKEIPADPTISSASLHAIPLSISSSASSSHELPPVSPTHTRPSFTGTHGLHVHRWHSNLESRLHPFWAGVLSNRTVRVSVRPHLTEADVESASPSELEIIETPLSAYEATTDAEGSFKIRFFIPWESLCTHPKGRAFVDPNCEHDFTVTAELMTPLPSPSTPYMPTEPRSFLSQAMVPPVQIAMTSERVSLTHSPIRVISDIDDTVKLSGVHCGARVVFQNVFVKDLEENLIPGMGEWYTEMWRRGVRFHYVSNGPFELLPVINDFFQLAKLPAGSVRLRSYGTRSLFSDLLSAPSDRKRDGVLEVLTSFPHSRFILIGDSGEQDLELYASVARDHPDQILCIFIRDVNTYEDDGGGIEDPTGIHTQEGEKKRSPWGVSMSRGRYSPKSMSSQSFASSVSRAPSESTTDDYFSRTPTSTSVQKPYTDTLYTEPETYDNLSRATTITPSNMPMLTHRLTLSTLSESERKRVNLQTRLWKACAEVPTHVPIRVFRDPLECVEAFQVIDPHLARGSN